MQNLIGFLLPPVIDLVNTKVVNSNLRFILSMVISAVVALVLNPQLATDLLAGVNGGSVELLLKEVSLIWVEAQVVYKLYWEKSQPRERLQKAIS